MREDIFIPEHKTNILPLRWLANGIFHPLSMFFFHIGLRANDKLEWDHQYTAWNKFVEFTTYRIYKFLNYPYEWWGTYYKLDLVKWKEEMPDMSGENWDDYDDMGIPYWDYWWHEDPETGDAWRLKPNAEKLREILNTESPWEI